MTAKATAGSQFGTMDEFTRVGRITDFPERKGRVVRVGDERVAVFRIGESWYAIQDACPHMGASLADGKLDGERVICHWHGWKFELRSGQGDMRSWARARVYETKVVGDELYIKPPPAPAARAADEDARDEEEWIRWDPERFFKKNRPD